MATTELVTITPKGEIDSIEIEVLIEEEHTDELQITEHPVQVGASITDHSFKKPSTLVLRCGWSNSSYAALKGVATSLVQSGGSSSSDYVSGVYSQLRKLQESRIPFAITTTLWWYPNMLIASLNVTRDEKTSSVLMVTATFREIRIVETKSTKLPLIENQSEPQKTAEVQQAGTKQLKAATPASGGSLPFWQWPKPKSEFPSSLTIPTKSIFGP